MPQFTFNGTTKRITIDSAFPDVIVSQMYSAWKIWSAESDNFKYLQAMRTFGGDATVTGQTAPAYFFLTNGWRVIVDGFDASFSFNLYTDEGEPPVITLTGGTAILNNSDVGIVKTTLEQSLDYQNGEVWVDFIDGDPGAIYPIGTSAEPTNNLADAVILCNTFGFHTIRIIQGSTIVSNITLDNKILIGNSPQQVQLQLDPSTSIVNARFNNVLLTGTSSGDIIYADKCAINSLMEFSGYAYECGLAGTINVAVNSLATFYQCASIEPGLGRPTVDFNPAGPVGVNIRMYSGGLDIINATDAGDNGTIEFAAGKCRVDSTCAAGYLSVRGLVELTDESVGTTVDSSATVSSLIDLSSANVSVNVDNQAVADAVWDTNTATHNIDGTFGHLTQYLQNIDRTVYVDVDSVINGNGSEERPYNNITDAIDYAEGDNIKRLAIAGDVTLDRNVKNFYIKGIGVPTIDLAGFDVTGCNFTEIQLEGTCIGEYIARDCVLKSTLYLNGFIENCALAGDLIIAPNANVLMKDCASIVPGLGRPTISMHAGTWSKASIRSYSGGLTITDSDDPLDVITVEISQGSLTFDSTCVAGEMVARGVGKFVDETNGATVVDEMIHASTISNIDTNVTGMATDITDLLDVELGNWKIDGTQMIFYRQDGITELARFNLLDAVGAPSAESVFERQKV